MQIAAAYGGDELCAQGPQCLLTLGRSTSPPPRRSVPSACVLVSPLCYEPYVKTIVLPRSVREHGDAANADCGEKRNYQSRLSRTVPFRSRLARAHYP